MLARVWLLLSTYVSVELKLKEKNSGNAHVPMRAHTHTRVLFLLENMDMAFRIGLIQPFFFINDEIRDPERGSDFLTYW